VAEANEHSTSVARAPVGSPTLADVGIGPSLAGALFVACAVLSVAGLAVVWLELGHSWRASLFDLDGEANIPTWYSSIQLSLAALCAFGCGALERALGSARSWQWGLVGAVLLYASVDEVAQLHEEVGYHLRDALDVDGPLGYFTWLVPYTVAGVVLTVVLIRFWWRLPAATRRGTALAALLLVVGGGGTEVAEGLYDHWRGPDIGLGTISAFQEACEMFAVAVLVRVELRYLSEVSVTPDLD
jgi:hypothetical protein